MEIISEIFGMLWSIWKEMFGMLMEILPKALHFLLWVFCGILILPCVFITGTFFPMWTDWGEKI